MHCLRFSSKSVRQRERNLEQCINSMTRKWKKYDVTEYRHLRWSCTLQFAESRWSGDLWRGRNTGHQTYTSTWGEAGTLFIRHTHQLGEKQENCSSDIHINLGRSRNIVHQTYTSTWGEAGTLFIRYTHQLGERQKYR